MQDSRAGSTLELVVNEQQMQNMSQIDLSGQGTNNTTNSNQREALHEPASLWQSICEWSARFSDSLAARLDEAKAKSETKTQYAVEVVRAFSGLIIWLLCFIGTIIVPILLLIIGLLNLDNCPLSPSLPYYVFTIGFLMTASNLFNLALALDLPVLANHRLLAADIKSIIASMLNIIFNTVVAFVYVLTAYKVFTFDWSLLQDGDLSSSTCSSSLTSLAYWFVTLTLGLFVIVSLLGALLFAYNRYRLAIIRGSAPRSHAHQSESAHVTITTNRL